MGKLEILVYEYISILVYWYISILVYWYIGMLVHWYVKIQILWYVDDVLFGFDLNVISSIRRSINIGISTSIAVSAMHKRICWSIKW